VAYLGFQKGLRREFHGLITKRSVQKQCKSYSKIHGQTSGASHNVPLNMPLYNK